ncbi:hypothetical protein B0F90DRAFT_192083 [Multifurca ochricompacta]|uniref:Uncharacterized protein n=1 Tax=Multifurca ochricompacta TaxID=376703 RepID=A0AAD4LX82_9AGAM|nr:hypothetical protein B0F90DRAFT_192083 [Multifurca ochricompacta]
MLRDNEPRKDSGYLSLNLISPPSIPAERHQLQPKSTPVIATQRYHRDSQLHLEDISPKPSPLPPSQAASRNSSPVHPHSNYGLDTSSRLPPLSIPIKEDSVPSGRTSPHITGEVESQRRDAFLLSSIHHRTRPQLAASSRPLISPEELDPTLSSWLKNINKLSNLIDRLQNLASTAPPEHRPHLYKQVAALRATSKKQQDRHIHFLQLTEEYANRYLLDISAEIQQQSSFLDMLEKRLDMAKTLRGQAVDLRKSYENGTVNAMKKVRETALSQPLPEDFDLLSEVDFVLKEIRRCYMELDKFWIEEIRRAVKAVKTRRVDQEDIQRWRGFQAGLEETIKSWKVMSSSSDPLYHATYPYLRQTRKVVSRH